MAKSIHQKYPNIYLNKEEIYAEVWQHCANQYFVEDYTTKMLISLLSGLITALSLLVVDLAVPGVAIDTFLAALIAALSIAVVNTFIRPFITLLSLPLTVVTFGLFSFVVNGLCFWLAAAFVPGFSVHGILGTIVGPIVLSFVSTFLSSYFADRFPALEDKA